MPQIVEIPDVGEVEFPDEMQPSDISDAIQNKILKQAPAPSTPAPPFQLNPLQQAQIQSGSVNPESDRNVFTQPSESERAASRIALEAPNRVLMAPFAALGKVGNAAVQDAATTLTGHPEFGGNLNALYNQKDEEPLPYQKTLSSLAASNPAISTAGKIGAGVVESLPVAAAIPTGELGRLASIGFTADMVKAGGEAALALNDELSKPKTERDQDKITSALSSLAQSAVFAPLAAKHGFMGDVVTVKVTPGDAARSLLNVAERDRTPTVNPPQQPSVEQSISQQASPADNTGTAAVAASSPAVEPPDVVGESPKVEPEAIVSPSTQIVQAPEPESFNSVDDILKFRQARLGEERALYKEQIGLSDIEAEKLQSLLSDNRGTSKFEKSLTPEQRARLEAFFEGPLNQKTSPFKSWETDSRLNPEELAHQSDPDLLSSAIVSAVERGVEPNINSDKFVGAAIAARRLMESGRTKSDLARYLDRYTTRNSGSQGDKAEYFSSLGKKVQAFLDSQGVDLPEGELGKKTLPKLELGPSSNFYEWSQGKNLNAEQDRLATELSPEEIQTNIDASKAEADDLKAKAKDEASITAFSDAANKLQFWNETLAKSKSAGETKNTAASRSSFMPPIVSEMIKTAGKSVDELKDRISNVRFAPYEEGQKNNRILFDLDGQTHVGELRGRNRDLVIGSGEAQDKAIAARALLDGDAKPSAKSPPTKTNAASVPSESPELIAERERIANGTKRIGDTAKPEPVKPAENYSGFTSGMNPMRAKKVSDALENTVLNGGKPIPRRALVEQKIAEGATITNSKTTGKRRLQSPQGYYLDESQIGKTAMGYAEHLIAQRKSQVTVGGIRNPTPEIAQVGDEVTWKTGAGDMATATVEKIYDHSGKPPTAVVDWFGKKEVPLHSLEIKQKSGRRQFEEKRAQPQGEIPQGPGGKTYAPSTKPEAPESYEGTSLKNAVADLERAGFGLEQAAPAVRKNMAEAWIRAGKTLENDSEAATRLAKELKDNPGRGVTDDESALLLRLKVQRINALNDAAERTITTKDPADKAKAQIDYAVASEGLQDILDIVNKRGTEWGREGRWRQAMAYEDMTFAAAENRLRASHGGRPLTDVEREGLIKQIADYKAKNDALQKHIDETAARNSDAALKEALDKLDKQAKAPEVHPKIIQIAERIVAGLDKRADAARQRIKDRGFRFNAGVDPTVLRDVVEIGTAHLAHKILDFAKWSDKMISEFGEGIKPHLDEIFAASNKVIDELKATPAVKRELKTPTPQERIDNTATKVVEKLKEGKRDEISGDVNRIARLLLEHKLVDGRDKLVDAIHGIIAKQVPDITRREIQDALSGYGDFKQLTKDEISVKLRGYRGELQQIAKLEDMAAGKPPLKTGVERRSPTDDERALIKAVNEAKIKFQVPITDPATQLKSALDTRKTQIENQTKDLERRLREGDFTKKPRRELVVDRRLQELTAARDAIKKKVKAAEIEARNKLRTNFEKAFDWTSNFRRAGVLSGNKVLLKLAAYSATKLPTMLATEAAGGVLSKLPLIRQVAERAPSEGGFSTRAIATAGAKFFTKGLEDAWKTAREGHSDIKSAFSTQPELQRHWYDFAQSMHEVIKSPLRRAAFELSLAKRMEFAAKKGADITDPLVQMALAKDAYLDSNRALLLENNRLASGIRGLIKQLEQKGKLSHVPGIGKAGATLARVEFPILTVPLNFVKQTMTAAFGLASGSAKLAAAFHRGIENLSPEEADSIMRHLKQGSIGGAVLLYGFYDGYKNGANGTFGGFYQPHEKRNKNQAQFGGARVGNQNISGVFLHNPIIAVGQLGHTIGAIASSKVKKNDPEQRGITVGALAGTMGLLNESPVGRTTELISTLSDPHSSGQALNDHLKGIVVPQLLNEAAQFIDKPAQNMQDYLTMEPRKRYPKGLGQTLETGIPLLRENVPLKKQ